MSAAVAVAEGISEARSRAIQNAAVDLAAGLDALVAVGGWTDGDTIPAVTVRWFVDKMRADVRTCLTASDQCEPEPGVQS